MLDSRKALAQEVAGNGVTVNTISPGYVAAEMIISVPENIRSSIVMQIPVGRLGRPEDVAHAVSFLVSENPGFITGAELPQIAAALWTDGILIPYCYASDGRHPVRQSRIYKARIRANQTPPFGGVAEVIKNSYDVLAVAATGRGLTALLHHFARTAVVHEGTIFAGVFVDVVKIPERNMRTLNIDAVFPELGQCARRTFPASCRGGRLLELCCTGVRSFSGQSHECCTSIVKSR